MPPLTALPPQRVVWLTSCGVTAPVAAVGIEMAGVVALVGPQCIEVCAPHGVQQRRRRRALAMVVRRCDRLAGHHSRTAVHQQVALMRQDGRRAVS